MAAVAIDVDERHVAELGIHIADPRHRRAVVEHAANEQHVAALEGKIAPGRAAVDAGVVVRRVKARNAAPRQARVADGELAQHVGGVAGDAEDVAQRSFGGGVDETARVPGPDLVAQTNAQLEDRPLRGRRATGASAREVDVEDRAVDLAEVAGEPPALAAGRSARVSIAW